ncbi:potassium-transporting ATPase subunit KdpA [Burkholderia thailandensis]|uniref:K+-transporting ATPase, A subunit n=1 Tax=Burkholderia thailandensis (strain ATCC 700388 / DSM 13276 / CCUG 48851 / CIP 106301 / E264) TaxID=271848 RepID=Q2T9E0_BURTA|nr:potassium-transporting ATPase subunit KdpA [Burkholderia thailandensis]ABC34442.1 K+-transporting ATPase, A subunit [Burkholderia thailandensis E264]MCS6498008.1 potassium-transporting ATPase subunit KdpA [Burkholderia thailandensis]MCS6503782.1 potassium-transporting ATPase subunit KdpA [Burkholderia thailandensis]MCS6508321.1 potassium-transporting ATPase subunit KdpA [Burkholderia thailandensis]MCS6520541.1 potassium-transporting ATPase subunit KdpA [Burkholderia thailandensis]
MKRGRTDGRSGRIDGQARLPQIALFAAVLTRHVKPLGQYIVRIANGDPPWPMRMLQPVERCTYRAAGIDPEQAMSWKTHAIALLSLSLVGTIALYALQRAQHALQLNPQALPTVSADSAFNTAVSFAANTSVQGDAGETTLAICPRWAASPCGASCRLPPAPPCCSRRSARSPRAARAPSSC